MARAVSSEAVRALLDGDQQFLPPSLLLGDLTEAHASVAPPGSPYSVAQVAAHLHFWQRRQIAWAHGETLPKVDNLDATFASPVAGEWAQLVTEILADVERLKQIAEEIGEQPSTFYDNGTVGYGLASSALHNGYHWGQIALLRRMQGFWPPAGAENDW